MPDHRTQFTNLQGKQSLQEIAQEKKQEFLAAEPFPHIVIDNLISEDFLRRCAEEFPDLSKAENVIRHSGSTDEKLASPRGNDIQPQSIYELLSFLNSSEFIDFLQELTSIKEPLIADPHFLGGGLHQIRKGGFLKIHADFCKHPENNLDRRLNVLLYLNDDWEEDFGGHLELYDKEVSSCKQRILPIFNRMVIFNTNDFTYHGHPDPLNCPPGRSRNSLALYYFSNGRPNSEIRRSLETQSTIYRARRGEVFGFDIKQTLLQFIPPIAYPAARRIKQLLRNK